jgi:hypothetical protein
MRGSGPVEADGDVPSVLYLPLDVPDGVSDVFGGQAVKVEMNLGG